MYWEGLDFSAIQSTKRPDSIIIANLCVSMSKVKSSPSASFLQASDECESITHYFLVCVVTLHSLTLSVSVFPGSYILLTEFSCSFLLCALLFLLSV